jgi:hypothetical protein
MGEAERQLLVTIVDRMERDRPRLLLFDNRPFKYSFRGARFEFHRYFRADARFEVLVRNYLPLGVVGGYFVLVLQEEEEVDR